MEEDKAIIRRLYWPDGTIKRRTRGPVTVKSEMCQMVQALVDKYNEDHNLLEVCSPFCPLCVSCYHCCAVSYCLVNVTIADLTHASYFRVLHTNSKTFYTTTQFVRTRNGTIISISLQRLKGLVQMNVTWTIFSLWK